MKRTVIAIVFALALAAWSLLDLGQYLTLDSLKAQQQQLDAFYQARPLVVMAAFFIGYVTLTALSVPGAAIMTLAAGALFGVVVGTVLVSFASSIGATLAFLV